MTDTRSLNRAAFVHALPQIARELATLEPAAGWLLELPDVEDRARWTRVRAMESGDVFTLHFDEHKNRIDVLPDWPRMPDGTTWYPRKYADESSPAIGVSAAKAPAQIARDIVRRFLPAYRVLLAKARERIAEQQQYSDNTADTFDRLVAAAPFLRVDHNSSMSQRTAGRELSASICDAGGASYGSMRVSGDSVTFERLSLTAECAGMVLAAIKACKGKVAR